MKKLPFNTMHCAIRVVFFMPLLSATQLIPCWSCVLYHVVVCHCHKVETHTRGQSQRLNPSFHPLLSGTIDLYEDKSKRYGFASCLTLQCTSCSASNEFYSSTHKAPKSAFAVNERASFAFRMFGGGHATLSKFAEVMDMPKPVSRQCVKERILHAVDAAEEEAKLSMTNAAIALQAAASTAESPQSNVEVSFDGSWSQRGYTAAYGYGAVVSVRSGKVLDYHVASKVCPECAVWDKKDPDHMSDKWKAWKERPYEECTLNHAGSARAMEADIAEVLWMRSQEKNNLRYTTFVGDGDGASFGRVASLKPYGSAPEAQVVKEDCIGHIQKRMGTRLREVENMEGEETVGPTGYWWQATAHQQ